MLNGVLEGKDTSLGLGLISNIGILLSHTDHHTLVARTANNGGEDSSGSVISSKSSFAQPEPLSTTRAATSSSHIFDKFVQPAIEIITSIVRKCEPDQLPLENKS